MGEIGEEVGAGGEAGESIIGVDVGEGKKDGRECRVRRMWVDVDGDEEGVA